MGQGNNSSDSDGGTRVDLGDDLLERTVALVKPAIGSSSEPKSLEPRVSTPVDFDELIQNARILINEQFIDDAKKVLRRILIADVHHVEARKLLDEVQALEMQRLFTESETPKPLPGRENILFKGDPEDVLHQLDRDLNLGLFDETVRLKEPFDSEEEMLSFSQKAESALANAVIQDWIDLGIAFLEMEFYGIAARLFCGANRRVQIEASASPADRLSATSLLAFALIQDGRPIEAVSHIQPILRDLDILKEDKVEFYYLMGRVYEIMQQRELAGQFYTQVNEIDPHYRDVVKRLRKMGV